MSASSQRRASRRAIDRRPDPLHTPTDDAQPVQPADEVCSAVQVRREDPSDFKAAYRRLVNELAQQRVALERYTQRLAELNRLGALVASSLDRAEVLRRVLHATERLLGAGLVRLWLLDEGGEQLRLVGDPGLSHGSPDGPLVLPVEGSLFGRTVRDHRPFRTADVLAEPLFNNRALAERAGLRACLVAPLLHEGRALGVLAVLAGGETHFDAEDLELLQALASYAALALENARLADEVGRLEGLREFDQLKAEFLSTVSHELRTPLSLIHGYAELLSLRDVPSTQVREMAAEIHRGSSRMIRMVDDLLDFSGLETGRLTLRRQPIDLDALLTSTGLSMIGQSPRHRLKLDLRPGLPAVLADPDRLRQILVNLLSNAILYSPDGGEITLRAWSEDGRVHFAVIDQGPGIATDEQPRVFEKFYRARAALLSTVRGSGLGLAIVRHLVDAHGGSIELISAPGQGTSVAVSLPPAEHIPHPPTSRSAPSPAERVAEHVAQN